MTETETKSESVDKGINKGFSFIPMCAECENDCKKSVSSEIFKSFQQKRSHLHCARFKRQSK